MTRVVVIASLVLALAHPIFAAAPTSPTNLVGTVSGSTVSFTWTAATGQTSYVLQAGSAPGQTSVTLALAGGATSFVTTAPSGTYFVRLVALNADGQSTASNEVTVVVGGTGCSVPAAPQNMTATFKGTALYLAWNASAGATSYVVQAGAAPGTTFQEIPVSGRTTLNANVSAGVFYARVVARNACGTSTASNEVTLSFPGASTRVPDPVAGTWLPLPDVEALVTSIGQERPDLMLNGSCPGGRKYVPNDFLDFVIARLRTYDTRWGYNAKPTKTSADNGGAPVVAAGDEIAYFAGAGTAEGSSQVYLIDILFSHCGTPSLTWRNFTGQEPGIWTGAGRFTGDAPRQ
ncbi:MAG: hypothetical protein AB7O67_17325 [Vicinamibacterales bacterium]